MNFDLGQLAIYAVPFLLAITFHELAHGWVARLRGDRTAEVQGRLTLNPLSHLDPAGTLAFVLTSLIPGGIAFGWAKPVPVNYLNLERPKRDMIFVAGAGPAANLLLAFMAGLLYLLVRGVGDGGFHPVWSPITLMLKAAIGVNAMLAVFNLIPLPPLDGGRVLVGLLPVRAAMAVERIEPYGVMILFLLLMAGVVNQVVGPLTWVTIRLVMRLAVAVAG